MTDQLLRVALLRRLAEVFDALPETVRDDDTLTALHHLIAHQGEPGEDPIAREVSELLDEIEAGSLGSPDALYLRMLTNPRLLARALAGFLTPHRDNAVTDSTTGPVLQAGFAEGGVHPGTAHGTTTAKQEHPQARREAGPQAGPERERRTPRPAGGTDWYTAGGSGGGQEAACVEVRFTDDHLVQVRDSKNRDGGRLQFTPTAWQRMTTTHTAPAADPAAPEPGTPEDGGTDRTHGDHTTP